MKRMLESNTGGNRTSSGRRLLVALLCISAAIVLLTDPQAAPARPQDAAIDTTVQPPSSVDAILHDDTGPVLAQDGGAGAVDITPLPPPDDSGNPPEEPQGPVTFDSDDENAAPDAEKDRKVAYLVNIKQPITPATASRVKRFCERAMQRARAQDQTPTLIFQFDVPEGQEMAAQGSPFGLCLDLADYISSPATADAKTAAYIPRAVVGHAVLVALACDDIFMAGDARIGPIGLEKKAITPSIETAYKDIPSRRSKVDEGIAMWLLDPTLPVVYLKTEKGSRIALTSEIDEINANETVLKTDSLEDKAGAEPGVIIGDGGSSLDIVSWKTAGPADLAKALNVKPSDIISDPALSGDVRPILVSLQGPIHEGTATKTLAALRKKIEAEDANLVIFWIDSPGGVPEETMMIAGEIANLGSDILSVAYVPKEALSDAALVALACDDLIVTGRTRLGGSGAMAFDADQIEHFRDAITAPDSPWRHRSCSLIAAMVDPDLTVYRCTRGPDVAFFSDKELRQYEQNHPGEQPWQRGMPVTLEGREFRCNGDEAVEFGLAREKVGGFEEMKLLYGVEGDPGLVEPGWHDTLIRALASPGLAGLLLTIGLVTLYAELHMPGIGIGGFIAAICFLLFFWSTYLGGTAGWLEIILFVTGITFLLLEVFVIPGFGVFGFGGGALVLISVFLATQTFVGWPKNEYQFAELQHTIWMFGGVAVGAGTIIYFLNRWLPESTLFKGNLILDAQGGSEEEIRRREAGDRYADLVGQDGITTTQLTPSGKAQIGDQLLSVITDGVLVPKSTPIRVVAVQGNRIFVEPTVPLDEDE